MLPHFGYSMDGSLCLGVWILPLLNKFRRWWCSPRSGRGKQLYGTDEAICPRVSPHDGWSASWGRGRTWYNCLPRSLMWKPRRGLTNRKCDVGRCSFTWRSSEWRLFLWAGHSSILVLQEHSCANYATERTASNCQKTLNNHSGTVDCVYLDDRQCMGLVFVFFFLFLINANHNLKIFIFLCFWLYNVHLCIHRCLETFPKLSCYFFFLSVTLFLHLT